YMSPEQASGAKIVDHRTDIYALGIILHRVLTGTIPHDAPTPLAILVKRSTEPIPWPREIKPDIPESLEHVVLRSLAKEPDARYSSATDFAEALRKARQDPNYREESIPTIHDMNDVTIARTPPPPPPPAKAQPAIRQNLSLLIGGAIALVVIIIGALIFFLVTMTTSNNIRADQPTTEPNAPDGTTAPVIAAATDTPIPATDTPTPVPTPVPPGVPAAVAKTDLEVYSGPGELYELLGYLPEGAEAEITGRDKDRQWWQIRTTLAAAGVAWIKADPDLAEVSETNNIPIALAPPPPTGTPTPAPDTPTPTATPLADTPTATNTTTPTRAATATTRSAPAAPTATTAPAAPAGQIALLKPISLDQPSFGMTEFEWQWSGPIEPNQGFEVRVWREGEPPAGVHNAVEDNQKGVVASLGNNTYRLNVNIREAFGVKGRSGTYLWTVALVQISPEYKDLGVQASLGRLRFEAGGGSGGGSGGSGGGGGLSGGD
ncbi:MAG: hypothetical protein HYR94_22205, partial [Chloroflexi bacterium]|nr:hypothetical protein [Chloroflexota bacterium]